MKSNHGVHKSKEIIEMIETKIIKFIGYFIGQKTFIFNKIINRK